MQLWRRLTLRLGAMPLRAVTWALAGLLSIWAVVDVMALRVSSGLANSTYDVMVRNRLITPPLDPRIVIVDIDEYSLQTMAKEFGRWPWPRDTLATLLTHLEKQQPAAIAWDILFADADRLSPGGDKAFNDAVAKSPSSHFSVTRLPSQYDSQSQISRAVLPGLWDSAPDKASKVKPTVALIPPALPAVAAAKLGFNNGYPDPDGVLRRYKYAEQLLDGSAIQSMAASVGKVFAINLGASSADNTPATSRFLLKNRSSYDSLMVWRKHANSYPRVSFADVFALAEGGRPRQSVGSFAGKVVLIGSTASSLHDLHPTPLSAQHAGVDTLATAIDNAINDHHLAELSSTVVAVLTTLFVLGMAAWVLRYGVASLDAVLLPLPAALLAVSYVSLNIGNLFVDLHVAAALALLFIALLKMWNGWRRNHWCGDVVQIDGLSLLAIHSNKPIADHGLDVLIRQLELHAPQCRIIGGDATAAWPAKLRWPEALRSVCVIGERQALEKLKDVLEADAELPSAGIPHSLTLPSYDRSALAQAARELIARQPMVQKNYLEK